VAEEEKEEETTSEEKPKSNTVLIIIIAVLVLVIILGGVITALMLSGDDEENVQTISEDVDKGKKRQQIQERRGEDLEVGPMFPLDNFIVNLLSESGRRFLKTQMNLELDGEELAIELEQKTPLVRDIIIRVLTSKTLEEISTAKGKEKLKDQLVNQLNLRLQDGQVKNVYFTEFVIQ
jgi:flagellar FliL protein